MRPGQAFLIKHFVFWGLMAFLAYSPISFFIAMVTLGMGAIPLMFAPTILLYSLAFLPVWFVATNDPRRWQEIAFLSIIPIVVAIGPGALLQSVFQLQAYRAGNDDFARPGIASPKTIEIVGDIYSGVFEHGDEVGDGQIPCGEICRRLLFNREVELVRMSKAAPPVPNIPPPARQSVTYRLEQRASCPQVYAGGRQVDKAFRDRLVAGDCLIAEPANNSPVDATVGLATLRHSLMTHGEMVDVAGIRTVRRLTIEQRDEDRTMAKIVLRHETTAETATLPAYLHSNPLASGPPRLFGYSVQVINPIDLARSLRDAFGFRLAPIEPHAP